jgi:hypothetical protein
MNTNRLNRYFESLEFRRAMSRVIKEGGVKEQPCPRQTVAVRPAPPPARTVPQYRRPRASDAQGLKIAVLVLFLLSILEFVTICWLV